MSSVPRPSVLLLVTLVCVLVAYSPASGAPFIWDDFLIVRDSALVARPSGLSSFFDSAFISNQEAEPGGRGYYRPLTVMTWAIDHLVHQSNPSGYHLTNLLLHALNTALLLGLLRRTGASALAASVGALLWALFPRLTEAVAWISGRTDVLAGTFVLLALTIWRVSSWSRRSLAALALLLGLLSKEAALSGMFAITVLELRAPNRSWRARLTALLPLATAGAVYAALRISAIGAPLVGSFVSLSRRVTAFFEALGRYASALVDAWRPDAQMGRLMTPSLPFIVAGAVTALGLGVVFWRLRRRELRELEVAGIVVSIAALGLVLHVLPLAVNIVAADRFLYLPLAGLALAATRGTAELVGRLRAPLRAAAVGALLASFAVATFVRTLEWTDEIDFWTKTFRQHPETNGPAAVELGNIYSRAGLYRHAVGVYQSYRDAPDSNYGMVGNNMASSLQSLGQYRAARHVLRQVLAVFPTTPKFRVSMALAELSLGNFEAADRQFDEALRLYPGYPIALTMKRRLPELRKADQKISHGDGVPALLERAKHSVEMGRTRDAFKSFERVIALGGLPRHEAEGALLFAQRYADPATTERIYRAYVAALGGQAPPDGVAEAYRLRQESARRLLMLWPELGLRAFEP
jgi:tetratricopeptide (TPR) repeat protein